MPAGDEYGIDFGGEPYRMDPFNVNATPLNNNWGWNWNDTYNQGQVQYADGGGGGGGPSYDPSLFGVNPKLGANNRGLYPDIFGTPTGQIPMIPGQPDPVPPQPEGFSPGHGVINPNGGAQSGLGQWGVGIPGLIGIGAGGLIYGGLWGGGGGGGGGGSGQGQGGGIVAGGPGAGSPNNGAGTVPNDQGTGIGVVPPPINTDGTTSPDKIVPAIPKSPSQEEVGGKATILPGPDGSRPDTTVPAPPKNPSEKDVGSKANILPGPTNTVGIPETSPDKIAPAITPSPDKVIPGADGGGGGGGGTTPTLNLTMPTPQYQTIPGLPQNRSYLGEGQSGMAALQQMYPDIFNMYAGASQDYANSDLGRYGKMLGGIGQGNDQLSGFANWQTQQANTSLRQGNMTDAGVFGGQQLAQRQGLNSDLYGQMDQQGQMAQQGIGFNAYEKQLGGMLQSGANGPGRIQNTLERQAMGDLRLGGSLSREDTRSAQQNARNAYSARGLGDSNSAMAAEVLNLDSMSRQRQNERRQFAQGVDAQGFNQRSQSYGQNASLGMGLANMDYGRQQQNFGNLNTSIQNRTINAFDPYSAQYMQNSQNVGMNQQLFGNAAGMSSGAYGNQYVQQSFNPWNNYNNGVNDFNANAENARYISAGNNNAAIQGAKLAQTGDYVRGATDVFGGALGDLFRKYVGV